MPPLLGRLPSLSFAALHLDRRRGARIDALLERRASLVGELRACLGRLAAEPDAAAAARVDEIADRLLTEHLSSAPGLLSRIDGAVRSNAVEILDDPELDADVREDAMRQLDVLNRRIGSYRMWSTAVRSCLTDLSSAHVYDLAAGTGGFALFLAAMKSPGLRLKLTSSDIDEGYVETGARRARELRVPVHFVVHDALALRDVTDVDLFVCTQAAHHFSCGQVVRMIAQAVRAATHGLLIIDLLRGVATMAGTGGLLSVVMPHVIVIKDGIQSVRRAWLPSELELLARAAGAAQVKARPLGPAHCLLHAHGTR